jgi:hypothetical protein
MPLYEYQGQQYEMAEEDPLKAKGRILSYLEKQKAPEPAAPVKPAPFSAKETAAALGQGILGTGKSLTDVFGADNAASRYLEEQNKALESAYSPERKAEKQYRAKLEEEAAKSGDVTKEISAYLGGIADAPVQSLAQGLGSIVPYVGTGILGGMRLLGGVTLRALNTVIGAAQGAGTIKGSVYDAVKDQLEKDGMKPEEAAAKASKAQEYLGSNWGQIVTGGILGGAGARYGVENLLSPGAAAKLDAKLIPRVAKAALAEAPLEGIQGGQEQLAQNLALQKEGVNVPTMQGVFGAAARDAALGALTAGAVGVRGPGAKQATTEPTTEEKTKEEITPPTTTTEVAKPPATAELNLAPKFDAQGNYIGPAETKAVEEEIPDFVPPKGETNEPRPDVVADRTSAEVSGEPGVESAAARVTPTDVVGVDATNTAITEPKKRESAQPSALEEEEAFKQKRLERIKKIKDPIKSFFTWAPGLPEDAATTDFPELVEQWGLETNQPQEIINELSGKEITSQVETTPIEVTPPVETTQKTQEEELEDQAEAYFAEEPEEVVAERLAAAPRTQSAENQQRQKRAQQRDEIIDEIKKDNTKTAEQKDTETHLQSYLVAAGNKIRTALDYLAGDIFSEAAYNDNIYAPFTGGKAAKAFYKTLSAGDKKYVDGKVAFLKNEDKRLSKFRGEGKDKAKAEIKAYEKSIMEDQEEDTSYLGAKENTGGTTPKLMVAISRGDLRGALQEIVNDTTNAFTALDKVIAKRLLLSDSLPALHVVKNLKGHGSYNNGTDVVTIREDSLESHTLLHEALHGFTVSYIRANGESKAVKELNQLYDYLKTNHPELADQYGMEKLDLAEFVAEVFSNRDFQDKLKNIPYKRGGAFTEFARKILQMLGISTNENFTALAQALISTESILTEGRKFQNLPYVNEVVKAETVELETKKAEAEPRTDSSYDIPETEKPRDKAYFKKLFTTVPGMRRLVKNLQNDRYEAKVLQDMYELSNGIIYTGNKLNNFYDWLTLSAGRAKTYYNQYVEEPYVRLNNALNKLAKEENMDVDKVLNNMHQYLEALHEPERRRIKYIMSVPMTKQANARRVEIIKILDGTQRLTKEQAVALRNELESIVNNRNNLDAVLGEVPEGVLLPKIDPKNPNYADQVNALFDESNGRYNVTGLTPEEAKAKVERFKNLPYIDEIVKAVQDLNTATRVLNQKSNYWSNPVENRANFYGWENYVPLKGINKVSNIDELLDYSDERLGGELVKSEASFEGRVSVAKNPILQTLSEATQAAMRAGRGEELTLSIKNAIQDGIIPGKVNGLKGQDGKPIPFKDRKDVLDKLGGGNKYILNYNKDGSVDILEISDYKILEAIRRTYRDTNSITNIANKITSGLGKMHTRYNFNFAPLNFVRDALTNAFNVGAKIGPFKAAEFLGKLAVDVATKGGMHKAFNVARLYSMPNGIDKIKALADKGDPIYKNMYDYIMQGGMVEYLQGMSIKSNFDQLNKSVGKSGIVTKLEDLNRVLDIWNNMFELASRSSAYGMMKSHYMTESGGKLSKEEASTKAAAFTKNLANFEQVGKYGKELGAAFMFFRPSATGAVRALEAAAPAFQTLEMARARLPDKIKANPEALAAWEKNYAFEQKSARYMIASLIGLGWLIFNMSRMMAPDDDLDRNKVVTDNMDQWNRFARFHFPFTDKVFQIPWGFGLGSFMAIGAQFAGAAAGNGTYGDALRNTFTQIALDSFVPIPVSRMKFSDDPALWVVDSVLPSFMRPVVEFTVNKNGLGQAIYNDSQRRMGDAYLGGDNIPQVYKDIAEYLNESTLGAIDWSPNSLYFLSNSYMDGPARLFIELPTSLYDLSTGRKDFSSKTDIPFVGSFIGTTSNVDAREFAEYEKDIKRKAEIIGGYKKNNLDRYDDYVDKYPFDEMLIETYDKGIVKLNKLRKEANEIRQSGDSPKEIAQQLKENKDEQNLLKNELIEEFKDYKD